VNKRRLTTLIFLATILLVNTGCAAVDAIKKTNDWMLAKDPLGTKARAYAEWESGISAPPIGIGELPSITGSSKMHIESWTDHRADITLSLDGNYLSSEKSTSLSSSRVSAHPNLSDGKHTFRAQARWCFTPEKVYQLALGKTQPVCRSSSASRMVVVDTTPPNVSVQLEPDGENLVVDIHAEDLYSTVVKVVVNRQAKDHNGRFVVPYHEIPPEGISVVAEDELGNRSDPNQIPLANIPLPDDYWVEVNGDGKARKIVAIPEWEPAPGIFGYGGTSWDHIVDGQTVGGFYTPEVWYLFLASLVVAIPSGSGALIFSFYRRWKDERKRRREWEHQRAEVKRQRLLEQKRQKLYAEALDHLAAFEWDEATKKLEKLPSNFKGVSSLLQKAKEGREFDKLCATATELATEGKWLAADSVLDKVPDDWQGQYSAAALKESIRERAAKAKAEAAVDALGKTYYEVLGVSRTANGDEVKKAYRQLAREYHPDVSRKSESETCFKRINEAHEVLSDQEKRAKYDRLLDLLARAEKFRRGKT